MKTESVELNLMCESENVGKGRERNKLELRNRWDKDFIQKYSNKHKIVYGDGVSCWNILIQFSNST